MFTIKCLFDGGHAVYECAAYRVRKPGVNIGETIADKDRSSLDLWDAGDNIIRSVTIDGIIYAMNAAGKTVDTFYGPPKASPTYDHFRPGSNPSLSAP